MYDEDMNIMARVAAAANGSNFVTASSKQNVHLSPCGTPCAMHHPHSPGGMSIYQASEREVKSIRRFRSEREGGKEGIEDRERTTKLDQFPLLRTHSYPRSSNRYSVRTEG